MAESNDLLKHHSKLMNGLNPEQPQQDLKSKLDKMQRYLQE